LCVELADALHVGCEPVVVERSVVGQSEGGTAEVGEGEVELLPELGLGVIGVRVGWVGGRAGGGLAAGAVEAPVTRVEVEDACVLSGELARRAVERIERAGELRVQ
jgi:hypothetical protein